MKKLKLIAFVGSARKKHTHNAVQTFLKLIEQNIPEIPIESEIINLYAYDIQTCKGCKVCFDKGEEDCPLKDDRNKLIQKILDSDGIIFASPVYSFQVASIMKIFIDRCAYLFHRPRLFGKTFTSIVTQGTFGGKDIIKYLSFIGDTMGCNVVKGSLIKSLEPMTEKGTDRNHKVLKKLSMKFALQLKNPNLKSPSLLKLMIFRLSRSSMGAMLDDKYKDFRYYKEQGWFESDFYYPVKLNPLKRVFGYLADHLGKSMAKNH